jgi:magnesium-transporting ATPase (P-type)
VVLYESPSPDESALLYGLREDDVLLLSRTKDAMTISVFGMLCYSLLCAFNLYRLGVEESYEILRVLEFSSDRKRMSVIVRNDRGKYAFLAKKDISDRIWI